MKDSFDRKIEYLRLSVTDACNMSCLYCKKQHAPKKYMSITHIQMLLPAFFSAGIRKIRLTGGEPLLHPQITEIVALCSKIGFSDIALTTNGLLLAEKAQALKANGLHRVNVSLNSLDRENYKNITGVDGLSQVLAGLDAARSAGLSPIKVNVVLMRGQNENEAGHFIALTKELPYQVRFIEYMKMGADLDGKNIRVTEAELLQMHSELCRTAEGDTPNAAIYQAMGYKGTVGFISPVTRPFCSNCTRLRVTSELTLRPCLGDNMEIDLKDALQEGALEETIAGAIKSKPKSGFCYGFETKKPMSQIGG